MPPIFILLMAVFAVLMVAMGKNPFDQIREENAKYGKDPLVREINKYKEESAKSAIGLGPTGVYGGDTYVPPQGAKLYRIPQSQIIRPTIDPFISGQGRPLPTPAPDIPFEDWGKEGYPSYMVAPSAPDAAAPGGPLYGKVPTGGPIGRQGSYAPPSGLSPNVK